MTKKILITGSNGFIGRALKEHLKKIREYEVYEANHDKYDLTVYNDCMDATKDIDIVIQLAGLVLSRKEQEQRPAEVLSTNLLIDLNIVRAAQQNNAKKIILFSSLTAYSESISAPFKEEYLWDGPVPKNTYAYGTAKRVLDILTQSYRQQYDIDITTLILPNTYGPGDKFSSTPPPLIPNTIKQIYEAKQNNLKKIAGGNNDTLALELLYIDDAVEAISRALHSTTLPCTLNVGSGKPVTIGEVYGTVAKAIGFTGQILWEDSTKSEISKRYLDTSLATQKIGWKSHYSLEDGILKTVKYFLENESKK